MFKAIPWNNEGVLVDTERLYRDATRGVLAKVGIDLSDDEYRNLFIKQNMGAWRLLAAQGRSGIIVVRQRLRKTHPRRPPFPCACARSR